MKIACPCGEQISDTTDSLPNKAYLLADQDWAASTDGAQERWPDIEAIWLRKTREIYQCAACGRLTFNDPVTGHLLWFSPEHDPRRRALGTVEGNTFRSNLVATWRSSQAKGDIFWNTSGDLDGGWETFADRDAWMSRYREVEAQLQREGRLGLAEVVER